MAIKEAENPLDKCNSYTTIGFYWEVVGGGIINLLDKFETKLSSWIYQKLHPSNPPVVASK